MEESKNIFSDNEYTIMSEIVENENVTQRELSRKLGISVSTVNVLINKMIKEGLVKMNQVSQKQVLYMLTPIGMMEKAKKTIRYLKVHYRVIYETKEKIKTVINELDQEHDVIFVLICDDEMGEIIRVAVEELQSRHNESKVKIIDKKKRLDIQEFDSPVLLHMSVDAGVLKGYVELTGMKVVNLLERL